MPAAFGAQSANNGGQKADDPKRIGSRQCKDKPNFIISRQIFVGFETKIGKIQSVSDRYWLPNARFEQFSIIK